MPQTRSRSLWSSPNVWTRRRSKAGCPICQRGGPKEVVATLAVSWASAPPRAPLPGYVAIISKRHAVEPFELPEAVRALFWQDVTIAAEALSDLLSPVKMNYEIHGNTVPHLHVHLYPRFADDPFVGGPIDPRRATFTRSRQERLRLGRAIQDAVSHGLRKGGTRRY
jgi:diadenosine tetraphosphate (Ap4A) HIT family hydrolase